VAAMLLINNLKLFENFFGSLIFLSIGYVDI